MKTVKIVLYIFGVIGICLTIVSAYSTFTTIEFISKSKTTTGTVIEITVSRSSNSRHGTSINYYPIVQFTTADGLSEKFKTAIGSGSMDYRVNDTVQVLYDPNRPRDARINSFVDLWLFPLVFGSFGLVFGGVGCGTLIGLRIKKSTATKLKFAGKKMEAKILQVIQNTNYRVNGQSPYQIICEFNDGIEIRMIHSDNIWYDPTPYIENQKIYVYINPNNPKKYYVDTSFLPELE